VKINKEIRALRIVSFFEALFSHVSFDSGFHFATQHIIVRVIVASHRFAAAYVVARYHRPRTATVALLAGAFFLSGSPRPSRVPSEVRVRVTRDVYIFIASGQ
jgi:hypothetical protein